MKNIMKKLLLLALLGILPVFALIAEAQQREVLYQDAWSNQGFTLNQGTEMGVRVTYSLTGFSIVDIDINGRMMHNIEVPGIFLPNNEGAPNVPGTGRMIALPKGAVPRLEIVGMRTEVMHNIDLAPAPRIPFETEDGLDYSFNQSIYQEDAFYPADIALLSDQTVIRGVDAVTLGVSPFMYNPVSKELQIIRDITVDIHFEGGTREFGENRLRSRWWDPIFRDLFLNAASLPEMDYGSNSSRNESGFEYLIITPDIPQFIAWADSIKQWRNMQGINTGIVTLTDIGGNTTALIEAYINNAYNNWSIPPAAVLLMADYGTGSSIGITSPVYNNYCISDHIYADVNGNHMADIAFARMTAQNEIQLANMVQKVLSYERQPPTNINYYNNPITAMGWQTERWFQLCSEVINGFFEFGLGKSPVRENAIYSGSPGGAWSTATNTSTVVNYFGPGGLSYIPSTTAHLTDWGGNATRINNDINTGAFFLQHRDHGSESGWGEPDYGTSDLAGLNNNDLPFIFSVNCLTGKFNYSNETFAEAFHRYPKRALGIIAATEVSYSFVNDAYVWGMYDNMWPDFMPAYGSSGPVSILPAFANVAGKNFLEQSSWPYNTSNKLVTYYLFHHHGDAFSTVYSELPAQLTVVHNPVFLAGANTFIVSADSGSLICLSSNGNILATATGTGSPVSIGLSPMLPGEDLQVTVTKQNYYRYQQAVMVIPPAGPYVIKDLFTLNDANGNGQADYGEEIFLNLQLKNVGIEIASGVEVSIYTPSPWIIMIDSTETYGDILADSILMKHNAFSFRIADYITDLESVTFLIVAQDTAQLWQSNFNLVLHAPVVTVSGIGILDPSGNNNGIPDPGEVVEVLVYGLNTGTSSAGQAKQYLLSTSPYVTIQSISPVTQQGMDPGVPVLASFNVSIDTNAPDGHNLDFITRISSGPYAQDRAFFFPIGDVEEDFETGNLSKFNWQTGGSSNWYVSNINPYQGSYSARSGSIGNNANTYLEITLDVLADDTISFFRKVSSEANYDFLQFYIDNVKKGQWSGNANWSKLSYPVTAGTRTFKWVYIKDTYMTGGSDAAWIDNIEFPPVMTPGSSMEVRATALHPDLCMGESTPLYAVATGAGSSALLNWTPSASLDNPNVYNPLATPTANTNYQVILNGFSGSDTAWVNVTVNPNPEINLGITDTTLCAGNTLLLDATVNQGAQYLWQPGSLTTPTIAVDTLGFGIGSITFQVEAINIFGCKDEAMVTIHFIDCTGLNELSKETGLVFFPNPVTHGHVVLQLRGIKAKTSIRLFNELGTLVREWHFDGNMDQLKELSLTGLPAGFYILQAQGSWGSHSGKLILR